MFQPPGTPPEPIPRCSAAASLCSGAWTADHSNWMVSFNVAWELWHVWYVHSSQLTRRLKEATESPLITTDASCKTKAFPGFVEGDFVFFLWIKSSLVGTMFDFFHLDQDFEVPSSQMLNCHGFGQRPGENHRSTAAVVAALSAASNQQADIHPLKTYGCGKQNRCHMYRLYKFILVELDNPHASTSSLVPNRFFGRPLRFPEVPEAGMSRSESSTAAQDWQRFGWHRWSRRGIRSWECHRSLGRHGQDPGAGKEHTLPDWALSCCYRAENSLSLRVIFLLHGAHSWQKHCLYNQMFEYLAFGQPHLSRVHSALGKEIAQYEHQQPIQMTGNLDETLQMMVTRASYPIQNRCSRIQLAASACWVIYATRRVEELLRPELTTREVSSCSVVSVGTKTPKVNKVE